MTSRLRPVRVPALLAASALLLSACGGESVEDAGPDPTPTPTTSVEVPEGAEITPPGTQLAFGETATVAHETRVGGAKKSSVLELTVDSAVQGSIKDFSGFNLDDPYRKNAHYYYVRVTVKNAGEEDFGGAEVPLWGISGKNTLLPVVKFTSSFKKCPTETLPKSFAPDAEFKTCLVYLSPDKGTLEGISYRPTEEFVPIEWRGPVKTLPAKPKKKDKKG